MVSNGKSKIKLRHSTLNQTRMIHYIHVVKFTIKTTQSDSVIMKSPPPSPPPPPHTLYDPKQLILLLYSQKPVSCFSLF